MDFIYKLRNSSMGDEGIVSPPPPQGPTSPTPPPPPRPKETGE